MKYDEEELINKNLKLNFFLFPFKKQNNIIKKVLTTMQTEMVVFFYYMVRILLQARILAHSNISHYSFLSE